MFMHAHAHEDAWNGIYYAWSCYDCGHESMSMSQNSQISWVLLGKIYNVLNMEHDMNMLQNHELFSLVREV